jgi:enediyne biosynthesis protein E4
MSATSPGRARLSRRHRRTLIAAGLSLLLVGVLVASALVRPKTDGYDPGATAAGIVSTLARPIPDDYPRVTFTDVTAEAGLSFRHFAGERSTQLPEDMGSGAAWGDFDNDGDDDLFIVNISGPLTWSEAEHQSSPAVAALYRNDGGRFVDVTEAAGLAIRGCGMGAAWGDADGDGFLDLVVTTCDRLWLFRNRGDGTFEDVTAASGLDRFTGFWAGASWADYDRDGDLDLYVTGYVQYPRDRIAGGRVSLQFEAEVPFTLNPSAFAPERNLLLQNDGRGRFADVAEEAGVSDRGGRSLSAAWCDFDDDGWLDLYVANDVSDNALFRNLGNGAFEDVSHATWVADPRGAMGLAVGDWDRDGDFDIFVTHWVAQENAFYSNLRAGAPGDAPGRLVFRDLADQLGLGQVSLEFVQWGTAFFDYDHDGRLDLLAVGGSTFQDPADPRRLLPMRHQLFWNRDDHDGFHEVGALSGAAFTEPTVGRGAALADFDGDGDLDILIVNHSGHARLLRNDGGNARPWLQVRARGLRDPSGFGAMVTVRTGDVTQRQQIGAQSSYLSQHAHMAHVGLGDHEVADEVTVRFPSGREVRRHAVPANQVLVVHEGAP